MGESFTGWVLRVAAGLRLHGRRLGRLLEELRPERVALRVDRVLVNFEFKDGESRRRNTLPVAGLWKVDCAAPRAD